MRCNVMGDQGMSCYGMWCNWMQRHAMFMSWLMTCNLMHFSLIARHRNANAPHYIIITSHSYHLWIVLICRMPLCNALMVLHVLQRGVKPRPDVLEKVWFLDAAEILTALIFWGRDCENVGFRWFLVAVRMGMDGVSTGQHVTRGDKKSSGTIGDNHPLL